MKFVGTRHGGGLISPMRKARSNRPLTERCYSVAQKFLPSHWPLKSMSRVKAKKLGWSDSSVRLSLRRLAQ